MNADQAKRLREPFPPNAVGKLPKPYNRDSQKGKCAECGGYHGLPAIHLDYVGHAAVTDLLLKVDPEWNWEPVAFDAVGLPAIDDAGGLWIRLTIAGVTRFGYGHADGKRGGDAIKTAIGDAIRNAAMRFGVALDLWSKENLADDTDETVPLRPAATRAPSPSMDASVLRARIAKAGQRLGKKRDDLENEFALRFDGESIPTADPVKLEDYAKYLESLQAAA